MKNFILIFSILFSTVQSMLAGNTVIKDFNLTSKSEQVEIAWACNVDNGSCFFIIEKSINAVDFKAVDTIGAILGDAPYICLDKVPFSGLSYYRIRCMKKTGEEITSEIGYIEVNASIAGESFKIAGLYPIPFADHINLTIECPEKITLHIACRDLDGKLLFETSEHCDKGCNTFRFSEWMSLHADSYYLTVSDGYMNTKTTHMVKTITQ